MLCIRASQVVLVLKSPPAKAGDIRHGFNLDQDDPLEESMATHSLQYSCLENLMDGGARQATVHRIAKSWT